MTGAQQHATDVGLARHDPVTANLLRQDVFVTETVLKRHHDRLRPDDRRCRPDGIPRVVGFDQDDDEVCLCADLGRGGASSDLHDGLGVTFEHPQARGIDGVDMSLERINQKDLGPAARQRAADGRA